MSNDQPKLAEGILFYRAVRSETYGNKKKHVLNVDITLEDGSVVHEEILTHSKWDESNLAHWVNSNYSREAIAERKRKKDEIDKYEHRKELIIMTVANVVLFLYNTYMLIYNK